MLHQRLTYIILYWEINNFKDAYNLHFKLYRSMHLLLWIIIVILRDVVLLCILPYFLLMLKFFACHVYLFFIIFAMQMFNSVDLQDTSILHNINGNILIIACNDNFRVQPFWLQIWNRVCYIFALGYCVSTVFLRCIINMYSIRNLKSTVFLFSLLPKRHSGWFHF